MEIKPEFSLIFVNFRSVWYLSLALHKIFAIERERDLFEVIVVNNDQRETRALERLAEQFSFRLVQTKNNLGFGGGANAGAAVARGRIFGFLNPDTEWQHPMLVQMATSFEEAQQPQLLGLVLTNECGVREAWSAGVTPSLGRLIMRKCLPFLGDMTGISVEKPEWTSGGALFVSREAFQRVAGFDERFFLYFEDVDFCRRAHKVGIPLVIDARFVILHRGGRSFHSHKSQKQYYYRSQRYYFAKHRPTVEGSLLHFFHLLSFHF